MATLDGLTGFVVLGVLAPDNTDDQAALTMEKRAAGTWVELAAVSLRQLVLGPADTQTHVVGRLDHGVAGVLGIDDGAWAACCRPPDVRLNTAGLARPRSAHMVGRGKDCSSASHRPRIRCISPRAAIE